MIIFDWDDTILPSSFVDKAQADNLSELPQHYHRLFREIEKCTEKCLAAAAKHGEVCLHQCQCAHLVGIGCWCRRRYLFLLLQISILRILFSHIIILSL